MPRDPVLVSNTREWLARAEEDLNNAQHDLLASPPFIRSALFHCQQAIEKAMKAFLTWHDFVFRKTHNLEELGELCTGLEPTLVSAVREVTPVTEYAAGECTRLVPRSPLALQRHPATA
jgi:HEPN domain-containing protein